MTAELTRWSAEQCGSEILHAFEAKDDRGLWLAWKIFHFEGGWLHTKITLVVIMSAIHGYLSAAVRKFAEDRNEKPSRHWRIVNEIPTLLLIAIVILVVVKPF